MKLMLLRFFLLISLFLLVPKIVYSNVVFPLDSCYFKIIKYSENNNLIGILQNDSLLGGVEPNKHFKLFDIKNKRYIKNIPLSFEIKDFYFSHDSNYIAFSTNIIDNTKKEMSYKFEKEIRVKNRIVFLNLNNNKFEKDIILDQNIYTAINLPNVSEMPKNLIEIKKIIFNPKKNYELSVLYSNGNILIIDINTNKKKSFKLFKTNNTFINLNMNDKSNKKKLIELQKITDNIDIEYSNDGKNILTTDGGENFLVLDYQKGQINKKININKKGKNKIIKEFIYDKIKNKVLLSTNEELSCIYDINTLVKENYFNLPEHSNNIIYNSKYSFLRIKNEVQDILDLKTMKIKTHLYENSIFSPNQEQILFTKTNKDMKNNIQHSYSTIDIFDIGRNKIIQTIECQK